MTTIYAIFISALKELPMDNFQKMTKTQLIYFILMSVASGLMIGIGGAASLLANNLLGSWGRLVGSFLFALGIFAIVTYEMKLFTGMIPYIPKMGIKNTWRLVVCFLGNIVGVAVIAFFVYFSPIKDNVVPQAQNLISEKLNAELWGVRALCSSMLCGALITLSVWSVKYAPKKNLSATLGVVLPIMVFAFCGFDHSIANMLYFYYLGEISWRVVGYCALCVVGNILGGVILPLIVLLHRHSDTHEH